MTPDNGIQRHNVCEYKVKKMRKDRWHQVAYCYQVCCKRLCLFENTASQCINLRQALGNLLNGEGTVQNTYLNLSVQQVEEEISHFLRNDFTAVSYTHLTLPTKA